MLPPQGLSASPSFASPGRGDLIAGRYRIERKLGAGGMGIVVAAIDEQTGQRVAIKLLLPDGPAPSPAFQRVDDSGIVERSNRHIEMGTRLIREASAASRLSSDHITRVLDVGRLESGDPFVVMEMLEGVDLNRYVKQRGPLPVVEAVNLVLQACEAIFEAHERGIVHRDLKPANLFLTQKADGSAFLKVLDFGISKVLDADDNQLTATSDMLGSPLYMAPEQIRNARDVDARADVWSLGTILYRLIAGRPAFEAQGSAATLAAIIGDAPHPLHALRPDVPPDLEAIVLRCLEKDRTRRVQSVRELAIALQRFAVVQTGSMLPAVPLPLPPPPPLPASISVGPSSVTVSAPRGRSTTFFAIVGVLVGVVIAGGLVAWRFGATESPAAAAIGAAPSTSAGGPVSATAAVSTTSEPSATAAANAGVSLPSTTAEPAVTAVPSATPSASASAATSSTPGGGATSTGAPVKRHPVGHGRPDDPLGDRL